MKVVPRNIDVDPQGGLPIAIRGTAKKQTSSASPSSILYCSLSGRSRESTRFRGFGAELLKSLEDALSPDRFGTVEEVKAAVGYINLLKHFR